jgi:hypothetical protein
MLKDAIAKYIYIIKNDIFVGNYIKAIGLAILIDWLMMAYFTKTMGMYVPLYLISFYYIVTELSGYINVYFKTTSLHKVFMVLLSLDFIQLMSLSIYFINEEYFIYSLMIIFSIQALMYEIQTVKFIWFIEVYMKNVSISEIQTITLFNKTNMVLAGLSISMVYSILIDNYTYMIMIVGFLMCYSLLLEYKLYMHSKALEEN